SFLPSEKFIPEYLYFYLKSIKDILESNASGTTFLELSAKKASSVEFPLPPIAEQQRIVNTLESLFIKLDRAREILQTILKSFENRKSAILHKAVTGELTAKWREENGVSLDSWEEKKLGEIAQFIGGGTPSKKVLEYWNGDIKWASVKDIKGDFLIDTVDYITLDGLNNSSSNRCQIGDLILITRISPGKTIIAKDEIAINQDLKIVKSNEDRKFLHYYFKTIEDEIISKSSGSTVLGIKLTILNEIQIQLPTLEEQTEIVRILDKLLTNEQQAYDLYNTIEKIDLMKKAILGKAFRGKLGTNDPLEEAIL
ncbi:MAG: hypothetical protein ATN35_01310, partial [Epulopiscium sp. Nele67-Bin004]